MIGAWHTEKKSEGNGIETGTTSDFNAYWSRGRGPLKLLQKEIMLSCWKLAKPIPKDPRTMSVQVQIERSAHSN